MKRYFEHHSVDAIDGCKSEEIVVPDGGIRNNCNSKNPGASAAVRDGPKGIQTKSNPNLVGARYPWQLGSFTGENGLLDANSVGKPYTNNVAMTNKHHFLISGPKLTRMPLTESSNAVTDSRKIGKAELISERSLHFPDYSDEAVRLQSFKHWGGVLPAQELAEGGFYMIARCDVVRCFSCNVVVQDWERSFSVTYHIHKDVYYGVPNIMSIKHQLSWKSKGANEVLVNNDKEQIKLIQHSPDWWSNPPWVSSDDSDKRFHEAQSQISLRPSKTKIMAWWSLCMLNILVSPFNFPPQWEGPVDYQSMAEAGFVYTGQEDLVYCFSCNINLDRWSKDMEPLLRHKEESPNCHKLQAIEGGKGEAPPSEPLEETSTGLNEQCLSYGNDACGVSVLVVGTSYDLKESSKTTASVNLAVQADYGDFSTSFTTHPPPQPSIEAAQLVPLPHFMNVTRRSGVLPFPDSTAVDYSDQQSLFPSFGDQGVICPPDFDVAMPSPSDAQTPSVPVQSSEADGCSAVLINQPMKTAFVGCDPSADVYKRPLILILHYSVLSRNKMVN